MHTLIVAVIFTLATHNIVNFNFAFTQFPGKKSQSLSEKYDSLKTGQPANTPPKNIFYPGNTAALSQRFYIEASGNEKAHRTLNQAADGISSRAS